MDKLREPFRDPLKIALETDSLLGRIEHTSAYFRAWTLTLPASLQYALHKKRRRLPPEGLAVTSIEGHVL